LLSDELVLKPQSTLPVQSTTMRGGATIGTPTAGCAGGCVHALHVPATHVFGAAQPN
jgi:hypothetical protein